MNSIRLGLYLCFVLFGIASALSEHQILFFALAVMAFAALAIWKAYDWFKREATKTRDISD